MTSPDFHPQVYKRRRQTLKTKLPTGIILFPGNRHTAINYEDNTHPFRQDSTFLYFFGISRENLVGVIDIDNDTDYLLGDEQTIDDIVWKGDAPSLAELGDLAGADKCLPIVDLKKVLHTNRAGQQSIHWINPYHAAQALLLAEWLNLPYIDIAKKQSTMLIKAVIDLRIVKDKAELSLIEEAVNVTTHMHRQVMMHAKPGMREYELLAVAESVALKNNCRTAYPPIVTINGQTLHNHYYGNTLHSGDLVLCDAGAELPSGYCGDITRTFPVDATFTSTQKDIAQIVLSALRISEKALKPHVNFKDIHLLACREITKGLQELGLMKGDLDASVEAGAHALFFQCGLGHLLGLDVHDMENLGEDWVGYDASTQRSNQFGLKSLRLARKLEEGFVLTVEPGIYFIPYLIDLWQAEKKLPDFINYNNVEKFRTFGGIRFEDNYFITNKGCKLIGTYLPRTVEEIEALRAS
ncbi:MAG TPA: aminopeptidase P family protein [Ohtaekwangia sp.]|nr:aminopeptidase P family protein [Ohtaekwangia sp.]